MNIVIKCGFQHIELQLRNSLFEKGKKLWESNHVLELEERFNSSHENTENANPNHLCKLGLSTISAHVIPQTSVSNTPYNVEIQVNKKREVVKTYCCCKAGQGLCKHIAATVFAINNEQPSTRTSERQLWGRPSEVMSKKYKKGKKMEELFDQKVSYKAISTTPPRICTNISGLGVLSEMLKAEAVHEDDRACHELMNYILDAVVVRTETEELLMTCNLILTKKCHNNLYMDQLYVRATEDMVNYYKNYVTCSEIEMVQICKDTLAQSGCSLWFDKRKTRIPSSKAHSVKTRRKDFEGLCQQFLFSKPFNNQATKYGIFTEEKARSEYSDMFQVRIIKLGLVISIRQPYLCCSPDGVVIDGSNIELVEIKCPFTLKNKPLVDFEEKKSFVPYLCFKKDELILKTTHQYYTQVQLSMYITGAGKANLFVYSKCQSVRIQVARNECFLSELVPKLQNFYFNYLLSFVCSKTHCM